MAALRALSQPEVAAFFGECALAGATRRQLSVRIEGHRTAAAASEGGGEAAAREDAAVVEAATDASAEVAPAAAGVVVIDGMHAFKRRQQLYGSLR